MNRLELAKQLDYLREAGDNAGLRIEGVQRWGGGSKGQSWCCYYATLVLDIEFKGACPIPRLGLCQDVLDLARRNGWVIDEPEVGCLVISINADGHAHHIGFCTVLEPFTVIAGNTSKDGKSSNGDGVYEHPVSRELKVFVRVPAMAA